MLNFTNIRPVGTELFQADRGTNTRMDGQADRQKDRQTGGQTDGQTRRS